MRSRSRKAPTKKKTCRRETHQPIEEIFSTESIQRPLQREETVKSTLLNPASMFSPLAICVKRFLADWSPDNRSCRWVKMISRRQVAEPYNRNAAVCGPFFFFNGGFSRTCPLQSGLAEEKGHFVSLQTQWSVVTGEKKLKGPILQLF